MFCDYTLEVCGLFSIRPSVYGLHWIDTTACYNVIGARRRVSLLKVFAMWYTWTALLLVCCTLVKADVVGEELHSLVTTTGDPPQVYQSQQENIEVTTTQVTEETTSIDDGSTHPPLDQDVAAAKLPVATTRGPPLTLDRQAAELAWRSWLQSPESGNQNAPPRRIITKSLFITPLVCPKGQRLDRNGCVQVVTVNKDEHERILLEQLNALFPSASSGDVLYDYGDDDPGPLQLSIPIGLDPQAAPLQGPEPSAQAQSQQATNLEKKDKDEPNSDASIEAELELLKLQHPHNDSVTAENSNVLNHNVMNNLFPLSDKPKRDSPLNNATEKDSDATSDEGQKELVYGHVNIDPFMYGSANQHQESVVPIKQSQTNNNSIDKNKNILANINTNTTVKDNSSQVLKKDSDKTKLNPENDYSDIGEAIKLISRYAEVTTDDNFGKNQKKYAVKDDSILGTRTKLQYRRNKPKPELLKEHIEAHSLPEPAYKDKSPIHTIHAKNEPYYRYPWLAQHSPTPPPDYPFRHLQDYWPGRIQFGGVYNTHENPRRHHHSYPHYFRPRAYNVGNLGSYPGQNVYPDQSQFYHHRLAQRHALPSRPHLNNQELYSLLGLRHWFSSESTSKR